MLQPEPGAACHIPAIEHKNRLSNQTSVSAVHKRKQHCSTVEKQVSGWHYPHVFCPSIFGC